MPAQEIIAFIEMQKETNVKVAFEGLATKVPASVTKLAMFCLVTERYRALLANLTENKDYVVEQDVVAVLADKCHSNARIEPGAIIQTK